MSELMILTALDGALIEGVPALVADSLNRELNFAFSDSELPDESAFRGAATDPGDAHAWLERLKAVLQAEESQNQLVVLPSFLVLLPKAAQELRKSPARIVFARASLTECWSRLGLLAPGQPVGLGPVRATWLQLAQSRKEAWLAVGAIEQDLSGYATHTAAQALFDVFSSRIDQS
ncbi:hypothetical protein BSR29_04540 [Boudabousia liubingyangii]|uniref:Uncharacterized protein n=1 Tax=Boudabousia liubingyangii TaxID=1921764 RepID=A0A1Q5PNW0_9ACTO|nr:hypothetical protein [Boudabousia liubingyangii]OKL49105.1 hypothetical protein BSR29_04540 [Boudabousia liubingyangii]